MLFLLSLVCSLLAVELARKIYAISVGVVTPYPAFRSAPGLCITESPLLKDVCQALFVAGECDNSTPDFKKLAEPNFTKQKNKYFSMQCTSLQSNFKYNGSMMCL